MTCGFVFVLYANSLYVTSNTFILLCPYIDMGSLLFQIGLGHMTDDSTVIGQAVVTNLKGLSATNPIKGYVMLFIFYCVPKKLLKQQKSIYKALLTLHIYIHGRSYQLMGDHDSKCCCRVKCYVCKMEGPEGLVEQVACNDTGKQRAMSGVMYCLFLFTGIIQ